MPRLALSENEIEQFRETLCASATRLFAENGYEGVTMRALATDLGCSAMTPYRYFDNKAEIFEAVRSAAFARFAAALEDAARDHPKHPARLRALCRGYVRFATLQPHAYRIIFELDQSKRPEAKRGGDLEGWNLMHEAVAAAVAAGSLEGDPVVVAHLLWSGVHGLVALHLSGMLSLGCEFEELVEAFIERELGQPNRQSIVPLTNLSD